ncbi:hypothetical protein D3C87_808620 [compost metagenome]
MEPLNDAPLLIQKQAVGDIGHPAGNGHKQYAGQQVVHVVIRTSSDGATKHIDEQQHHRDRSDADREDGVNAAENMAHGTSEHNTHITEKVIFCSFHLNGLLFADDCEEYFLKRRLFFNILHLGLREPLLQLHERPSSNYLPLVQNGDSVGKLLRFL